jgi:hypothetical protein
MMNFKKLALFSLLGVFLEEQSTAFSVGFTATRRPNKLALQMMAENGDSVLSRRSFFHSAALLATSAATPIVVGAATNVKAGGAIQYGDESIMILKAHGTSEQPVQSDLLYGVSNGLADKICNYNRHFAEMGGYFRSTRFEDAVLEANGPITFYDSVTGKPLFVAPLNRSPEEFLRESEIHGWPSFRDEEVVWENVRVLKNSGETVSVDGTLCCSKEDTECAYVSLRTLTYILRCCDFARYPSWS